jgi:hypothetical protein
VHGVKSRLVEQLVRETEEYAGCDYIFVHIFDCDHIPT